MLRLDKPGKGAVPQYSFDEHDLIKLDGLEMRAGYRNSEGIILTPVGQGPSQHFSHAELRDLLRQNRLKVEVGHFKAGNVLNDCPDSGDLMTRLDGPMEERVRFREALVLAFFELERRLRRDGQRPLKRTDEAITAHADQIRLIAKDYYMKSGGAAASKTAVLPTKFSARSLRRWISAYTNLGRRGLVDNYSHSGNRETRFPSEVRVIMAEEVKGYLSSNKPTKKQIADHVRDRVEELNIEREALGQQPLPVPSRNAVATAIDALDPFTVAVAREGRDKALRKMRQTRAGLTENLVAPLTRVEMDEWRIDLFSIFEENGLLDFIDDEDRKRLGLNGKKTRWWATVAICATTRVIVGMRLSLSPSQYSSLDCLQMILNDKGQYADAVGALSPWNMAGRPTLLVTDGGSAFKAADFRAACADLKIPFEIAVNGLPQMRARIERVFRTMGVNLMPRLSGRSFESIAARGDHDGEAEAALSVDDLAFALTRWVVDIYHNTPHEGLGGDTPLETWDRLVAEWGVRPAPGPEEQAAIFARPMVRNLEGDGITVLGIRYHSDELAQFGLHRRGKAMNIRWSPADLGAIWVKCDGWIRVPAVFDRFKGVTASDWVAAARRLRMNQRERQKISRTIIRAAIKEIETLNDAARRRAGLVTESLDGEVLARIEEQIFIGFGVADHEEAPETRATGDGIGVAVTPIDPTAPTPPPVITPQRRSLGEDADDWDLGN